MPPMSTYVAALAIAVPTAIAPPPIDLSVRFRRCCCVALVSPSSWPLRMNQGLGVVATPWTSPFAWIVLRKVSRPPTRGLAIAIPVAPSMTEDTASNTAQTMSSLLTPSSLTSLAISLRTLSKYWSSAMTCSLSLGGLGSGLHAVWKVLSVGELDSQPIAPRRGFGAGPTILCKNVLLTGHSFPHSLASPRGAPTRACSSGTVTHAPQLRAQNLLEEYHYF